MAKKKPAMRRARRAAPSASTATTHAHHSPPTTTPRTTTTPRRPTPTEPTTFPDLLTPDEVAKLLRTSREAIYAKIRRGQLPGVVRLSRRVLIDGAKLLEWLDHRRAVSLPTQGEQR